MGRELQKKKRRSGISKAVRKPKSKKQVLNNPVIAANWDSKQTLSQNYARLGLTTRLNKQTGGKENFEDGPKYASDSLAVNPSRSSRRKGASSGASPSGVDSGIQEVRVERDPETGKIIQILDQSDSPALVSAGKGRKKTAAEISLEKSGGRPFPDLQTEDQSDQDDASESGSEFAGFADTHASGGFIGEAARAADATPVVHDLTGAALAAQAQPRAKRRQSERERQWCARMIEMHGGNYKAMFRDRTLNVLQLSEGQLRQKMEAFNRESSTTS